MTQFQTSMIDKIDHMTWLEITNIGKPMDLNEEDEQYVSKWPLLVHMISAVICLGFSANYHLFYVYSENACTFLVKMDYAGISILVWGSAVPIIENIFVCQ